MDNKALIFDFNGTLYFDSPIHEEAWDKSFSRFGIRLRPGTDAAALLHGRNASDILRDLKRSGGIAADPEEVIDYKEALYRKLCIERNFRELAPGAQWLLDECVGKSVPIAIATASQLENVEFYKDYLGIRRWFSDDRIIYNDGSYPGKPAPDIYLRAAERLGVPPVDCIVFEDAVPGVQSARNAGIGKIIGVAESVAAGHLAGIDYIHTVIEDYGQFELGFL